MLLNFNREFSRLLNDCDEADFEFKRLEVFNELYNENISERLSQFRQKIFQKCGNFFLEIYSAYKDYPDICQEKLNIYTANCSGEYGKKIILTGDLEKDFLLCKMHKFHKEMTQEECVIIFLAEDIRKEHDRVSRENREWEIGLGNKFN